MEKTGTAYFADFPRILDDLKKPHLIDDERPYKIVATVALGKMDYDNFCTDMVADRQFIEDNYDLCGAGPVWKCLFVHQRGRKDGVLIVPTDGCYVKYAAYIPELILVINSILCYNIHDEREPGQPVF